MQEIQIERIYLMPEIIEILKVRTRETREGWPLLLTVETEMKLGTQRVQMKGVLPRLVP